MSAFMETFAEQVNVLILVLLQSFFDTPLIKLGSSIKRCDLL